MASSGILCKSENMPASQDADSPRSTSGDAKEPDPASFNVPATMRGLAIDGYDEKDPVSVINLITTLEVPTPSPDEVLIEVHAASVNAIDYKLCKGWLSQVAKVQFPFVIGRDCAGIVVQYGINVNKIRAKKGLVPLQRGMRVAGQVPHTSAKMGTFSEYTILPANSVNLVPDAIDFNLAASLVLAGQTSYQALVDKGKMKNGDKVLILGGSTGTGLLGIQIAKALGASEIAVTSSQEEMCQQFGATKVYNYKKFDETKLDETKEHCWYLDLKGKEYDIVYDCVGGKDAWTHAKEDVLSPKGHFVTIVGDTFFGAPLTLGKLVGAGLGIAGRKFWNKVGNQPSYDNFLMDVCRGLPELFEMCMEKKLVAVFDEESPFKMDDFEKMMRKSIERRAHGKLVLQVKGANDNAPVAAPSKADETKSEPNDTAEEANKDAQSADDAAVDTTNAANASEAQDASDAPDAADAADAAGAGEKAEAEVVDAKDDKNDAEDADVNEAGVGKLQATENEENVKVE